MIGQALVAPAPMRLWKFALHRLPSTAAITCLSDDERERARRFAFDHLRRRYLAAHVALREILAGATGLAPGELTFVTNPFGKPTLVGVPGCTFNMSHSDDVAVVAVAPDGEIGVDVEVLRHVPDSLDLARRNFTPNEYQQLRAAAVEQRDLVFLRGWTRKEACIKAQGHGLSIAPESFEAGVQATQASVAMPTPEGPVEISVVSLPEAEGCVMALAWVRPPQAGSARP